MEVTADQLLPLRNGQSVPTILNSLEMVNVIITWLMLNVILMGLIVVTIHLWLETVSVILSIILLNVDLIKVIAALIP